MTEESSLGSVEVALSPQDRFDEFLQSRKKRNTQERRLIVQHIFSHHQHFDANQLIDQLARRPEKEYGRVSRPTVYRTLNELTEAGLLRKFELDGRAVFEHDYGYPQHDHLHCTKCNKLYEFQSDELIALRDAVARDHRFRVAGHRLIISGICESCAQAKRRMKRKVDLI
jgi:Fur family ferric uptake transcriptional regulator